MCGQSGCLFAYNLPFCSKGHETENRGRHCTVGHEVGDPAEHWAKVPSPGVEVGYNYCQHWRCLHLLCLDVEKVGSTVENTHTQVGHSQAGEEVIWNSPHAGMTCG